MILKKDSKISEAIFKDPSAIQLFARFGINLGVGDMSVESACDLRGIDVGFFLAIVNTYINNDYFPGEEAGVFSVEDICAYLDATDDYYSNVQLPNIERHFNSLIRCSGGENNNLGLLRRFFLEMKDEFLSAIAADRAVMAAGGASGGGLCLSSRVEVEEKIADLLAFFVLHLKGDYDPNLCTAVVSAVFMLDKDVRQSNRIRTRLLAPRLALI